MRQSNVIVFNVHTHTHYRCDTSKQGAASVMRLKADSDRVKEVYKELSAFATRKHTNGNSKFAGHSVASMIYILILLKDKVALTCDQLMQMCSVQVIGWSNVLLLAM